MERTELGDDKHNEGDESVDRAHMEDRQMNYSPHLLLPLLSSSYVCSAHPLTHIHRKKVSSRYRLLNECIAVTLFMCI